MSFLSAIVEDSRPRQNAAETKSFDQPLESPGEDERGHANETQISQHGTSDAFSAIQPQASLPSLAFPEPQQDDAGHAMDVSAMAQHSPVALEKLKPRSDVALALDPPDVPVGSVEGEPGRNKTAGKVQRHGADGQDAPILSQEPRTVFPQPLPQSESLSGRPLSNDDSGLSVMNPPAPSMTSSEQAYTGKPVDPPISNDGDKSHPQGAAQERAAGDPAAAVVRPLQGETEGLRRELSGAGEGDAERSDPSKANSKRQPASRPDRERSRNRRLPQTSPIQQDSATTGTEPAATEQQVRIGRLDVIVTAPAVAPRAVTSSGDAGHQVHRQYLRRV